MDIDVPETLRALFDAFAAKLQGADVAEADVAQLYDKVSLLFNVQHAVRARWLTDLGTAVDAEN